MAATTPAKLLPARARLSTALQSVAPKPFTRSKDADEDEPDSDEAKRRQRRRRSPTAATLSAALQQLKGAF